jgi:hypothetical protein
MKRATMAGTSVELGEPTSYREALSLDYAGKWGKAIHAELQLLKLNETWEYVPECAGAEPIGFKWVFKMKTNPDGSNRYPVCQET